MTYDEDLDKRIHKIVGRRPHTTARRMFGGVGHMWKGHMFCGVLKKSLILRLGAEQARQALTRPHVRPFDVTGQPMSGWVMVDGAGVENDAALQDWLKQAMVFVASLPPK